jgi:hypothetical protein
MTYLAIFTLELIGQIIMGLTLGASIAWGMKLAGVRMTIAQVETIGPKEGQSDG